MFQRIRLKKKFAKIYKNQQVAFHLKYFSGENPEIEVLRQFQFENNEDVKLKDKFGFIILVLVNPGGRYEANFKETKYYKDAQNVDLNGNKYVILCENDALVLNKILSDLKLNVFETLEGDEYSLSLTVFPPRPSDE